MKILLLGANGQVGWELQRSLSILGELIACDRQKADLEKIPELRKLIRETRPTVIVNAAAYTAVDKAETDEDRARVINADAVKAIAEEAKMLDAWLVHYSTDYVFGDTKTSAYFETDATNPLNVYAQTKCWGEEAIVASACKHLIFRTSWVYAVRGSNFVKTILKLAKERDQLKVIADQVGAPTSAALIADVTALVLSKISRHCDEYQAVIARSETTRQSSGIYHLTASGEASWYDFAKGVVEEATAGGASLKLTTAQVLPIPATEYPLPAKRPLNSRLNTDKLQQTFGVVLPDWRHHLKRTVKEILA
jgi:dTDP-4-dehydrorhamnose reductase